MADGAEPVVVPGAVGEEAEPEAGWAAPGKEGERGGLPTAAAADAGAGGALKPLGVEGGHTVAADEDDEADPYTRKIRGLAPKAFFVLGLQNPLRKLAITVYRWKVFDNFILFMIIMNCIFLAMSSNRPGFEDSKLYAVCEVAEIIFTVVFTLELLVKSVSMDFIYSKGSYLRDPWNVIDFLVVVLGLIAFSPAVGNYTAIRTVRVLRPLRTITGVEGMRVLVSTLMRSIPMLLDVLVLCAFAFFIFGIIGVQTFKGVLRNRCHTVTGVVESPESGIWEPRLELAADLQDDICGGPLWYTFEGKRDENVIEWSPHGEAPFWAYSGAKNGTGLNNCPGGMVCSEYENPNFGITNFDNILYAWLTIFQAISMEGWTDIMYQVQDAVNPWVWIYFVVMIVFGSFFAVNLALAVLYLYFTDDEATGATLGQDEGTSPVAKVAAADAGTDSDEGKVDSRPMWKQRMYSLALDSRFEALTMGLIIFNTIVMAAEHHPSPDWLVDASEVINWVLSGYFGIEMIIKIAGLGVRGYMADSMNTFDGVVVIMSFVEITLAQVGDSAIGGSLSVLRTFRLMRVFKLARSWKELNRIINTIFKSLASIAYLSLILLLFVFIFALLGMQFFGYKFYFCDYTGVDAEALCPPGVDPSLCPGHRDCYVRCDSSDIGQWLDVEGSKYNELAQCLQYPPGDEATCWQEDGVECWAKVGWSDVARHNFDNIYWSVITIFQILTGENWNEVMYDGMRSTGSLSCIYFLLLFILGNYIILNLFLAILLDNFGGGEEDEEGEDGEEEEEGEKEAEKEEAGAGSTGQEKEKLGEGGAADASAASETSSDGGPEYSQGKSLWLFAPDNKIRQFMIRTVTHKRFEAFIISLIVISSILLAIDSPHIKDKGFKDTLAGLDTLFVVLFTLEAVMKIIAMGGWGQGAYFWNGWNILDFTIVIIGIVLQAAGNNPKLSALKALRTFRALRPLRVASRSENMKVVVNALFLTLPPISNVLLVCFLFYLIFGILGVNLFGGTFWHCADADSGEIIDVRAILPESQWNLVDKAWCEMGQQTITWPEGIPPYTINTEWVNLDTNFDNIAHSILTLFEMASLEMWLDVMYAGVDARGVGLQPHYDNNPYICIFFVLFIIVGAFFVLNLFVGVTIDKFNEMKEKQDVQSVFLTQEQMDWAVAQKLISQSKPVKKTSRPEHGFKARVFDVVTTERFDATIMGLILLNITFMAMDQYKYPGSDSNWELTLFIANLFFTSVFLLEAVFKMYALSVRMYFADSWNTFDFAVVTFSIAGIITDIALNRPLPVVGLLRVLRVARIFRLIPKMKGLKTLFETLVVSLPALINVGSVLILFFFIFAIMGMNLFGLVKFGENLNRHANFKDFPSSMLVLFRMATGESWNGIMHDCMIIHDCVHVLTGDLAGTYVEPGADILETLTLGVDFQNECSPNPVITVIYFILFTIFCAFILLNLVIAVILDNFQMTTDSNDNPVSKDNIEEYRRLWSELDPNATNYIPASMLIALVLELKPLLGLNGISGNASQACQKLIMNTNIPARHGKVHYLEVLHALAARVSGTHLPPSEESRIHDKIADRLPSNKVSFYTASHYYAVQYVQAAIRGLIARERESQNLANGDKDAGAGASQKDL